MNHCVQLFAAYSRRINVHGLLTEMKQDGWHFALGGEFYWREGIHLECGPEPNPSVQTIRRSGIGQSAQEAMTRGIKLALRLVDDSFHAAIVTEILMKEYPWFFLARVTVLPYRFLHGAETLTV